MLSTPVAVFFFARYRVWAQISAPQLLSCSQSPIKLNNFDLHRARLKDWPSHHHLLCHWPGGFFYGDSYCMVICLDWGRKEPMLCQVEEHSSGEEELLQRVCCPIAVAVQAPCPAGRAVTTVLLGTGRCRNPRSTHCQNGSNLPGKKTGGKGTKAVPGYS